MYKKLEVQQLSCVFKEAVALVDAPKPQVNRKHALVKNLFAGVNATDINITAGRYFTDGVTPFDIGFEGCGIVEKVGEETSLKVGQAVMYVGMGAFSEYLHKPETEFIPIPEARADFIALLVCGMTAAIGLDKAGRMVAGDKVFITAAAGGTGHIAVQWAKMRGCHVIGTCSTEAKGQFLRDLGVDRVINYKKETMDEVLKKEYPNGVDVIWETIGGSTMEMLFEHLAAKGRMVVIGGITGYKSVGFPDVKIPNLPGKLVMKSCSLNGFLLTEFNADFPEYMQKMTKLVMEGKLKIKTDIGAESAEGAFDGVADIARAVEHLLSGQNCGKVVVPIQK